MSQSDEDDPFQGLVTSSELKAHPENRSDREFSKRFEEGDLAHRDDGREDPYDTHRG